MDDDLKAYIHFTGKSRLDKSINSLLGLIEGIAIDGQINSAEIALMRMWLEDHRDLRARLSPRTTLSRCCSWLRCFSARERNEDSFSSGRVASDTGL